MPQRHRSIIQQASKCIKIHHVRFMGLFYPGFQRSAKWYCPREHLLTFLQWFNSLEPASELLGRGWRGRIATILSVSSMKDQRRGFLMVLIWSVAGRKWWERCCCVVCVVVFGGGGTILWVVSHLAATPVKKKLCRARADGWSRGVVSPNEREQAYWSRRALERHPNSR